MNAGKMPKTIDVEIRDDLIDQSISGDIVTVCGVMKTEIQGESKSYQHRGGYNKTQGLFSSYIEANSAKNSNNEMLGSDNLIGQAEMEQISKLSERNDLFALLVKSACPSIWGHEMVKAGLILSLFGGTNYQMKSKSEFMELHEVT